MGANKEYLKGLEDASHDEKRLAEELQEAEEKAGIAHPEEE